MEQILVEHFNDGVTVVLDRILKGINIQLNACILGNLKYLVDLIVIFKLQAIINWRVTIDVNQVWNTQF